MKNISCKEAVDLILRKEEGKISLLSSVKLQYHLTVCRLCRTFLKQNSLINRHVRKRNQTMKYRLSDEDKESIIHNALNSKP